MQANFATTIGSTRYYYNVQVVAIKKPSARLNAQATLQDAAAEKQRKYSKLQHCFHPIIISTGGLMEIGTAQTYKSLQRTIGPVAAAWLNSQISFTLARTHAISAASISRPIPSR